MKKHLVAISLACGSILLWIATMCYPGGSSVDVEATGYDWFNNYISNLLSPIAVNGMQNSARPWAVTGILLLTAGFGLFFVRFSQKISDRNGARVIKLLGIAVTVLAFLTVIPPLHDIMVMLSSILTLIIFFYITVFTLKSKLRLLKLCAVLFLSTFYLAAFMYFTRSYLEFMPLMQKIIFVMKIVWVLSLEYFTTRADFLPEEK